MRTFLLYKVTGGNTGIDFLDETLDESEIEYELVGKFSEKVLRDWYSLGLIDEDFKIKEDAKEDYRELEEIGDLTRNKRTGDPQLQSQVDALEELDCKLKFENLTISYADKLISVWCKLKDIKSSKRIMNAKADYRLYSFRNREEELTDEDVLWVKKNKIKENLKPAEIKSRISGKANSKQLRYLEELGYVIKGGLRFDEAEDILRVYEELDPNYSYVVKSEDEMDYFEKKGMKTKDSNELDEEVNSFLIFALFLNSIPGLGNFILGLKKPKITYKYVANCWIIMLLSLITIFITIKIGIGDINMISKEGNIEGDLESPIFVLIGFACLAILGVFYFINFGFMQAGLITDYDRVPLQKRGKWASCISCILPGLGQTILGDSDHKIQGLLYFLSYYVLLPIGFAIVVTLMGFLSVMMGVIGIVFLFVVYGIGLLIYFYFYNYILVRAVRTSN